MFTLTKNTHYSYSFRRRKSGASRFIFATEDGTISGWSPAVDATQAILAVNHSRPGASAGRTRLGAVYKGLAIGNNGSDLIDATNFRDGVVEMYNVQFQLVKSLTDSGIPIVFELVWLFIRTFRTQASQINPRAA